MRHRYLRFALMIAALTTAPGAMRAQIRDSASVVAAVGSSEGYFLAMMTGGDSAQLHKITWPQFAFVSPHGTLTPRTRAEWFGDPQAPRMVQSASSPRNFIVRVFSRRPPWHRWADMAIVSFVADFRTAANGGYHDEAVFITDTWRLDGNQWRILERSTSQGAAAAAK
jgi:hypothetical protein